VIAVILTCAALAVSAAAGTKHEKLRQKVVEHRAATWYWQGVMFRSRTPTARHEQKTSSTKYLRWLAREWYERRVVAMRRAQRPPNLSAWLCIHRGEGSWTDPNAPYFGGLQMDWGFMSTYGGHLLRRKGTADNWTMWEQIWVAERARASGRGFYPWPTTARRCGLI
jgi:hypothetical protein